MLNTKFNHGSFICSLLIGMIFVLTACQTSDYSMTLHDSPEKVVNEFMYLIMGRMDFEKLMALGDYPKIKKEKELNFYLLDMKRLVPYENFVSTPQSSCVYFEKRLKHFYHLNELEEYHDLDRDKQNCLNDMHQIERGIIALAFDLSSGIKLVKKTYKKDQSEAVLEYTSNSDKRKIVFDMIKKNNQWYFKNFSYLYIVHCLGHR